MWHNLNSIKSKMLLTTLVSVLLGVAGVLMVFIPAMVWRASYVKQLETSQETRLAAASIQSKVLAAAADTASLKQSPLVTSTLTAPTSASTSATLANSLSSLLSNKPQYLKVSVIDELGQELVVVNRDLQTSKVFSVDQLNNIWSEAEFQAAQNSPSFQMVALTKNSPNGSVRLCLVTPVTDATGRFNGAVVLETDARQLLLVEDVSLSKESIITDTKGKLVLKLTHDLETPEIISNLPNLLANSNTSRSGLIKAQQHYIAHTPINLTPDRNNTSRLLLVSYVSTFEAIAPILKLVAVSGVVLLVFLSLIGAFTYWRVSSFLMPLQELVRLSRKIGRGDFSDMITIKSDDELNVVASSFNSMVQRLASLYSELEKKVADQNQQLEQQLQEVEQKNLHVEQTKNAMLNLAEDLDQEKNLAVTQKARVEAILQNIGVGVVVIDKKGVAISANSAACELLGYSEKELQQAPFTQLIPAQDGGRVQILPEERAIVFAEKTQQKRSQTMIYTKKDGSQITVFVVNTPIIINGSFIGQVLVIRDVTQEKAVDRMKTEFISLASHQLRTPLSTVNWYLELVLGGDAGAINDQQRKFIEEAYQGSKRLVALVRSLLDVSRIELGTFSIEPVPTNIENLVQSVVDELKPLIDKKQLDFQMHLDQLPELMLDPELTRIMIQNVLTNAVKYTSDTKQVKLEIRQVIADQILPDTTDSLNTDALLISVTDQGAGIPSSQQPDIFKKLFRADNTRKLDTEGTGLGLYIIKELLDQMGGKIWFNSVENQGSRFHIVLPLSGMRQKTGSKRLGQ